MKRPGRPNKLLNLNWNIKTGLYEISEDGITYGMELEMTREMKKYFSNNSENNFKDWFRDLSKFDKGKVARTGNIQEDGDAFYYICLRTKKKAQQLRRSLS